MSGVLSTLSVPRQPQNGTIPKFTEPQHSDDGYRCVKCKQPLHYKYTIMQMYCGHRISHDCLAEIMQGGSKLVCPVGDSLCRTFDLSQPGYVIRDFAAVRQLSEKKVYCNFRENGCQKVVLWRCLEAHTNNCVYRNVICVHFDESQALFEISIIRHALRVCFDFIIQHIQIDQLLPSLHASCVLTNRDLELLTEDKHNKNQMFMDMMIAGKNEKQLNCFLQVLKQGQKEVFDHLEEKMDSYSDGAGSLQEFEAMKELGRHLRYTYKMGQGELRPVPDVCYPVETTISKKAGDNFIIELDMERPLSWIENLFKQPGTRLVHVKGEPGTGKSTLLRKIAFEWSQNDHLDGIKCPFQMAIPIAGRFLHPRDSLEQMMVQAICRTDLVRQEDVAALLKEALKEVKASSILFLIDGFDEIPCLDQDSELIKFLKGQFYPYFKIVLTSRGYQRYNFGEDITIHLQGFSDKVILQCLEQENYDVLTKHKKDLQTDLFRTPLHLVMLTSILLKTECRDVCLPKVKTDLWNRYLLQMILSDEEQQECKELFQKPLHNLIAKGNGVPLKVKSFVASLGRLSHDLYKDRCSVFQDADLEVYFIDGLDISKSGLFSISNDDQGEISYQFLHIAFQEFLAATYLTHVQLEDRFLCTIIDRIIDKRKYQKEDVMTTALFGRYQQVMEIAFQLSPKLQEDVTKKIFDAPNRKLNLLKHVGHFKDLPIPKWFCGMEESMASKVKYITAESFGLPESKELLSGCWQTLHAEMYSKWLYQSLSLHFSRHAEDYCENDLLDPHFIGITEKDARLWMLGITDVLDLVDLSKSRSKGCTQRSNIQITRYRCNCTTFGFHIIQRLFVKEISRYTRTPKLEDFFPKFLHESCHLKSSQSYLGNKLNQSNSTVIKNLVSHYYSCVSQKAAEMYQGNPAKKWIKQFFFN